MTTNKTIAIYGGSFNPPTIAHYIIPTYLLATGIVDNVMVMPSFLHPDGKVLEDFSTRMKMCDAMFRNEGRVIVSDIEKVLGGLSLSLRTVKYIVEHAPSGTNYRFVVGTDCYVNRETWKSDWDAINEMAPFLYMPRPGYQGPPESETMPTFPDISSTTVRNSLKQGKIPDTLMHKNVAKIICDKGLYEYASTNNC